jgi:diguanylate cyclase (GGDEF)-like protein/PAS domain S-box-containing protein
LIPPPTEVKQALRLQRFGLALFGYLLATTLASVAWLFGVLPGATVLEATGAFVVVNVCLYAVIRSGFNLRFEDPSLTRFQILAAITILMYLVYHMDDGREVALFGCFVVFLFGIFRLTTREFVVLTLYTLAAYAFVINLLMELRPQAIHNVYAELMAWLGLAGFLSCFTIVGEQINALRLRMRAREARFRRLTEMTSDFFWESDADHGKMEYNALDLTSSVSRVAPPLQAGQGPREIPGMDEAGWREHRGALDAHEPFRDFEISRLDAAGLERHISISGDPVFDVRGAFRGYEGVGTDITLRKRAEEALREAEHSLRMFADNIPVMTVSLDLELRCRFANKLFGEFFGVDTADIVGKHLAEILGDAVYREIEGHFARALQGYPVTYQRIRTLESGEARHIEVKVFPDVGDHGKVMGCFTVTTDITEHKRSEERIQHVAHHDSLTGLPNRLLFNDRLNQALFAARRGSRTFALLYLDLNLFKSVNDKLGHAVGDELLVGVARRFRRLVRESDTVARVGGDEFTVILPHIAGREEAEAVAGKIAEALATPFELGSPRQSVQIGTSIGIAIYPMDGGDAESLVKAADADMFKSKVARSDVLPRAA